MAGLPRTPTWTLALWLAAGLALLAMFLGVRGALSDGSPSTSAIPAIPGPTGAAKGGVRVDGTNFVGADGAPVRLRGFNMSGAEYSCIAGWGTFDTPDSTNVSPAVVSAMANWRGANAVRVPLNEQCWLGIGVAPRNGGAAYHAAISDFVTKLNANGFLVILDLHRSAPGTERSLNQEKMPDRDHSVDFWREVAQHFGSNPAVLFDLFNEPVPFGEPDSDRAWLCWRDGGCRLKSTNGNTTYTAAGMTELISAIRSTGARNVVLAGGIYWAEILTRWLAYEPTDPAHNLAASFHAYSFNTRCVTLDCYRTVLAAVTAQVPLLVGEIGPDLTIDYDRSQNRCAPADVGDTGFDKTLFDWLDEHQVSFTAWTWNNWQSCWSLIKDWSGTPTSPWGSYVQQRLARPN